jgi:hypothetical protein
MLFSDTITPKINYIGPTRDLSKYKLPNKYHVQDSTFKFNFHQLPVLVEQHESDDDDSSTSTNKSINNDPNLPARPNNPQNKHKKK